MHYHAAACRANHGNIFGTSVGLELRKYRYFNSQTRGLDYQV
jgi:aspartate/tyrosine/aromatic aminotransferase